MRREINRKILHVLTGTVFAYLLFVNLINLQIILILFSLGLILSYICTKTRVPVISDMLDIFDREERIPGYGSVTYILGIIAAVALFDNINIVCASIMVLAWGDSASALVGKGVGRIRNPLNKEKTMEGTFAGMLCGFVGAALYIGPIYALIGAVAGAIIEIPALRIFRWKIDDNITVPVVAGLAMQLLML